MSLDNRNSLNYKGVRVNAFGVPIFFKQKTKERKIPSKNIPRYNSFYSSFKKDSQKDQLVIYDIPQDKKRERDWFRRQLIRFDYTMVQKSIWIGPSPLPLNFLEYVRSIGLKNKFKIFKLAKSRKQIIT